MDLRIHFYFYLHFVKMRLYINQGVPRVCTHAKHSHTDIKDPVVHIRVWCCKETLKHPAHNVGWVAQLCHSLLSSGKATQISHEKSPWDQLQNNQ